MCKVAPDEHEHYQRYYPETAVQRGGEYGKAYEHRIYNHKCHDKVYETLMLEEFELYQEFPLELLDIVVSAAVEKRLYLVHIAFYISVHMIHHPKRGNTCPANLARQILHSFSFDYIILLKQFQ